MNTSEKKNSHNYIIFDEALQKKGLSYKDVYYRLNGAGITEFNDIISPDGRLIMPTESGQYLGERNYHAADNGERKQEEFVLDCKIGNVQEAIFCLDNVDFQRNENATDYNVKDDSEITTKNLDLIHIPTGVQVELKNPKGDKLYGYNGPKKAYYSHRDSGFRKFIREGNIMIINFMGIKKVAVVSKENFKDPEMGKPKGGVEIPKGKEHIWDAYIKKYKDTITVVEDQLIDYDMMVNGNSEISNKISKIIENRGTR